MSVAPSLARWVSRSPHALSESIWMAVIARRQRSTGVRHAATGRATLRSRALPVSPVSRPTPRGGAARRAGADRSGKCPGIAMGTSSLRARTRWRERAGDADRGRAGHSHRLARHGGVGGRPTTRSAVSEDGVMPSLVRDGNSVLGDDYFCRSTTIDLAGSARPDGACEAVHPARGRWSRTRRSAC